MNAAATSQGSTASGTGTPAQCPGRRRTATPERRVRAGRRHGLAERDTKGEVEAQGHREELSLVVD